MEHRRAWMLLGALLISLGMWLCIFTLVKTIPAS
jgi:hypothetical protein